MEGGGTIAGTVKIHSPKFAPPAVGSGVVRLTWSGSQTPAAVRKLRVEGSHTRFLRSQTQRPFANFALSFWRRKVPLRQCAGPIVYRPLPFCPYNEGLQGWWCFNCIPKSFGPGSQVALASVARASATIASSSSTGWSRIVESGPSTIARWSKGKPSEMVIFVTQIQQNQEDLNLSRNPKTATKLKVHCSLVSSNILKLLEAAENYFAFLPVR